MVIEDYLDYDDLFNHVDVFVTGGGYGSSLAAFLHGVPVVGAGKREGKNDVNARVGYNKLGHRPAYRTPETSGDPPGGPHRPRRPRIPQERRDASRGAPRVRPDDHDRERHPDRVGKDGLKRPQVGA